MDLVQVDVKKKTIGFSLKRVNRILRWTGVRLFVGFEDGFLESKGVLPPKTKIGLEWYGWGFIKDLENDLPL